MLTSVLFVRTFRSGGDGECKRAIDFAPLFRGLPAVLNHAVDGRLDYTIRDVLAATHEAVFEAVMAEVDAASARPGGPALAAEVTASLLNAVDEHNEALRQLGLIAKRKSARRIGFDPMAERVHLARKDHETFSNGLRRWRGGLSESDLCDAALQADRRLRRSCRLLGTLWHIA